MRPGSRLTGVGGAGLSGVLAPGPPRAAPVGAARLEVAESEPLPATIRATC